MMGKSLLLNCHFSLDGLKNEAVLFFGGGRPDLHLANG